MAGFHQLQAGGGEQGLEVAATVAAMVMVRLVVGAPHPGIGRGGGAEPAAGLQHPAERGDGLHILDHVLEHVEGADQVEAALGQIQAIRKRARPHPRDARGGGVAARPRIGFQAGHLAEAGEHGQVAARAAADFQDAGAAGRPKLGDQALEDPAAGGEPPVMVLQLAHPLVGGLLHQSSASRP